MHRKLNRCGKFCGKEVGFPRIFHIFVGEMLEVGVKKFMPYITRDKNFFGILYSVHSEIAQPRCVHTPTLWRNSCCIGLQKP